MMRWKIAFFILSLVLLSCRDKQDTVIDIDTSLGTVSVRLYNETPLHRDNFKKLVREGYYNGMLFHRVISDFMIQAGDPNSKGARAGILLGADGIDYTVKSEILPQFFHKRGVLAAAREGDNVNPERNSSGSHFYIVQGKVFQPDQLDSAVQVINNRRYKALFEKLKRKREGEIMQQQVAGNYDALMRINEELSAETRSMFDGVKLKLTDEQRKAYTTVGGTPHLDGEYTVFGEVTEGMDVVDRIAAQITDANFRPVNDVIIRSMKISK